MDNSIASSIIDEYAGNDTPKDAPETGSAPAATPPSSSIGASMVDEMLKKQEVEDRIAVRENAAVDAARQAEAVRLGKQFSVPSSTAYNQIEELRRRQTELAMEEKRQNYPAWSSVLSDHDLGPIAQDPANAADLQFIEDKFGALMGPPHTTFGDTLASWYGLQSNYASKDVGKAAEDLTRLERLKNSPEMSPELKRFLTAQEGRVQKDFTTALTSVTDNDAAAAKYPESKAYKTFFTPGTSWSYLLTHPELLLEISNRSALASAPSAIGAAGGFVVGGPAGGALGAFAGSADVEFASTLHDELAKRGADFNDPQSVLGIWKKDGEQIVRKAEIRGGVVGLFDAASAFIGGKIGGHAVEEGVKQTLLQLIGKEFLGVGVDMAFGAGGEATAEVASGDQLDSKQIAAEALGELFPGVVQTTTAIHTETKRIRAEAAHKELITLGDRIRASKTVQTSPETILAHAQAIDDGGHGPSMSASAEALHKLFQSENFTPEMVASAFPEVAQALNEAAGTNAEVPLPAKTVVQLAQFPGFTALADEIRTAPDMPTAKEAREQGADLEQTIADMSEEDKRAAVRASVEAEAAKAIAATGQDPKAAATMAKVHASVLMNLAEKNGMNLEDLVNEYKLVITGNQSTDTTTDGTTLTQNPAYGEPAVRIGDQVFKASDYFPNWEKGTRENGAMSIEEDMAIADWGHKELLDNARKALGAETVDAALEANPEGVLGHTNAKGDFKSLTEVPRSETFYQTKAATSTPEFKTWFGDSKVVDEQGAPLVVYHGTDQSFDTFDLSKSSPGAAFGPGIYLTEEQGNTDWKRGDGSNVMPLFASVQNPLDIRQPLTAQAAKALQDIGIASAKEGAPAPLLTMEKKFGSVGEAAKAAGFDGLFHYGPAGKKHILVFDNTQIKSATGNRGTFDPNNPNILYQSAPAEEFLSSLNDRERALVNPIYTDSVPAKKLKGNEEAARWLENHFTGNAVKDFTKEIPDAVLREIGNVMAAEAIHALRKSGNAFDWYSHAMQRALQIAAVKWPVLASDTAAAEAGFGTAENARFVFTYIMAVTSQNLDVAANAAATNKAFDEMLVRVKAGDYTMSKAWGTGDKQAAMGKNFAKFGPLIEAMDGETFPEKLANLDILFREKRTVAEWVRVLKEEGVPYSKPGQTAMDAVVYGSSLLGPKIGNGFWQNLNGNFSPLTIDLWMRRTWGRLTGKSIGNEAALPAQRKRLKASIARSINSPSLDMDPLLETLMERRSVNAKIRALEARTDLIKKEQTAAIKKLQARLKELTDIAADYRNIPAPEPWKPEYDKDNNALAAYAKRLLGVWNKEYKALREKYGKKVPAKLQPTWARGAKRLKADLTTPLDQVANGTQRKQIEKAVAYAQAKLTELGFNITTADLQAILWYPEKELWGALTSALAVDEDGHPVIPPSPLNESYDTVFTRILNAEGYDTGAQQGAAGDAAGGSDGGAVAGGNAGERGPGGPEGGVGAAPGSGGSEGPAANTLYQATATRNGSGRDQGGSLAPLPGAPVIEGASGPDPGLVSVAERYAQEAGIDYRRQGQYVPVDPERAKRIAAAYEAMPHAPQDPAVKAAYDDLIRQTVAQYQALEAAGYKFYFFDENNDPYQGNPWNAMRDLRANKTMGVFATEAGFGSGDTEINVDDNPMLADTGIRWAYGPDGEATKRVLANDLFRAVHDAFGHGLEGAGFRAQGEENAWQAHVRLFHGPAVAAITTETRGQNSWLNYGPHGEKNQTAGVEDTVFADQKTGLMPPWTWEEGRAADEAPETGPSSSQTTLNQKGQSSQTFARGSISFTTARNKFTMTLTGRADLSTFMHEAGHYYLEVIQDLVAKGKASPELVADLEKIRAWMGLKPGEAIEVRHHEMFARGFEAYLMEGRAPSVELQGAFNRLRAWMVFIYKRLSALNVDLTDEVRGVFDRLLASDAAIAEARTNIGWGKPLPKEALYLSDEEYDRYVEAWNKANEEQQREVDARLMLEAAREAQEQWKNERRQVFDEEKGKIEQSRGWRAWKLLSEGVGLEGEAPGRTSLKIDPVSVPPGWARDAVGMTEEGGLPIDTVAEILGFDSGEQMLSLIAGSREAMKSLPADVKKIMQARHGDLDATALADLATAAVQSDKTHEVLLTEYRAMAEKAGIGGAPKGMLEWMAGQAKQKVLALTRRQLDPVRWRRAQLKAAAESAKAAAKGDMTTAAIKKRQQMMAAVMERATLQADKRIETIRKKLMPFTKNDRRAKLGKAGDLYLDAIDEILEGIQLKNISAASVQKLDRLAKLVEEADAKGEPLQLPDKVRAMLGKKHLADMTLDELEGIHDTVMNIWHLAKTKNELRARAETREMENVLTEMEANAQAAMGDPKVRDGFIKSKLDRYTSLIRWGRAQLVKMEFLFGWLDGKPAGGLMHRYIYQPLADANREEYKILGRLNRDLYSRLRDMPREQKARWNRKITFMGEEANGATIISAALNLGNASNKQKLLEGYGWNEQRLMAEINAFMTKADWDIVQHIWDQIDTLWPQIEETTRLATGLRPEKVAGTPVATPFGTYAGGYYPVVYDPDRTEKQFKNQQSAEGLFSNNFVRPTLGDGFTKARVDYAAPILLDLSVISRHLSEVVHFVTHYEAVTQADKITRHPRFQKLVKGHMGNEFYREIRPWLQDIARAQDSPAVTNREILSKGAKYIRGGMSISQMGYNLFTGMKQLFGVVTTLDAVGPTYWMSGLQKSWLSPNAAENWRFALKESAELEPLITSFDRDIKMINDTYAKSLAGGVVDAAVKYAFAHIGYFQLAVNVAAWHGAYEQALGKGLDHEAAVKEADAVVRQTQSSGAIKDLSAVQRGSEASRMVSLFYSFFSVLYNRLEDINRQTKSIGDVPRAARRIAVLVFMSAMIDETTKRLWSAGGGDDGKDDDKNGFMLSVLLKSADMMIGSVPLIRGFLSAEYMFGNGFKPEAAPVWRVGEDVFRAAAGIKHLVTKGEMSAGEAKAALRSVSVATRLPLYGAANSVMSIYELASEMLGGNVKK